MSFMGHTISTWRSSLANLLGLSFGGSRDYYKTLGYKPTLTQTDYLNKYLRQDIASRVMEQPVDGTWSDPPIIEGPGTFKADWIRHTKKISVYSALQKLDLFCGLGQYAILVIGFNDGGRLSKPVKEGGATEVMYLQPYLEGSVKILEYEENENSPRFGLPLMYEVDPGQFAEASPNRNVAKTQIRRSSFKVHWTRVLHVADLTLENGVFGHSRLERVYNVLDDIFKVAGSSAETYWLTANRGMHVNVEPEMTLDEEDEENLSDEIDEYQNQLRRVIRTRGVKIESLGSDMADPRGVFEVQLSLLSSATGIPKRILAGAEAGQLASQQDRANWAVRIAERQSKFAQPYILVPYIKILTYAGVLPNVEVEELKIEWPDAFKMSPLERAQTSAQIARSMTNAVKAMTTAVEMINEDVFSIEEVRAAVSFGYHMPVFDREQTDEEGKVKTTYPTFKEPPQPQPQSDGAGFGSSAGEGFGNTNTVGSGG